MTAIGAGAPSPRLGIHLRNFSTDGAEGWAGLVERAVAADRAGIDKLVVSDHVAFGEALEEYARPEVGGVRGGRQPTGPDGHWLEPVTLLAYLAARTQHARLTTHVLLAALRRPVVLAKSLATLDVLCDGRLDIGVGVGWQRAEYDAAWLDFEDRGRLLDEAVETCQTLWRERAAFLTRGSTTVGPIHQMPPPVQDGGVPIWISGRLVRPVIDRLVRFGAGWIPWGDDAADLRTSIPRMRELVTAAGGDASRLRVVGTLPTPEHVPASERSVPTFADLPDLLSIGLTDVIVQVPLTPGADPEPIYRDWVEAFRHVADTARDHG